ncbi:FKBP-type peptidyl-prolyl cis-trans isomerase [Nonomuraea sp. LPB2021202275-12-8]|uniref:FKBP-type peptidyl-prolyl cis-trans isomerase n=1 Tax=Nonomuraea sp. LPB2021202275-12-8 TaxID=3120159 RepID=UPI00300CD700
MRLLWPAVLVLATSCGVTEGGTLPVVTGTFGARPIVAIPRGKPGRMPRVAVLSTGSGRRTMPGDVVLADVEIRHWSDNKPHLNTYDTNQPATIIFDGRHVPDTWRQALIGQAAGSRVLLVGTAAEALGPDMEPDGVDPAETLVVVFDILGGYPPDARLVGRPLPAVPADLTPTTPPRTLIGGSGAEVRAGAKVVVQYVAAAWPERTAVDSSYRRGGPSAFTLVPGAVPPGWLTGLLGQRVGGRVAIGSPTSGPPMGTGEPMLYVVDILDSV